MLAPPLNFVTDQFGSEHCDLIAPLSLHGSLSYITDHPWELL